MTKLFYKTTLPISRLFRSIQNCVSPLVLADISSLSANTDWPSRNKNKIPCSTNVSRSSAEQPRFRQ